MHFSKRIGMALSKFTSLVILKMCIWTVWLWLGISSGRAATAPGGVREFNIILSDCCSILGTNSYENWSFSSICVLEKESRAYSM